MRGQGSMIQTHNSRRGKRPRTRTVFVDDAFERMKFGDTRVRKHDVCKKLISQC